MYACGSFACENFFSYLRFLSQGNNSVSKAKQIIENKEVLDYCMFATGKEVKIKRPDSHCTSTFIITKELDE